MKILRIFPSIVQNCTMPKRRPVNWEDLRIFLALARHGSLSAAARALSVNHATVARRIQSLEAAFNEKLVDRRPDGYILTPAGTRALAAASDMEAAAGAMGHRETDHAPRGLVRVNAPPALAQSYLTLRLARLTTRHPGLDIDFAGDIRPVSLERHETDVAVRLGRLQDAHVVARKLALVGFGFYAIPFGLAPYCHRRRAGFHRLRRSPLPTSGIGLAHAALPPGASRVSSG